MVEKLSWDDFRLIKAIADTGTLPAAADRLGVAHSTVFRRLKQVEETHKLTLFERNGPVLTPTQLGEEIVKAAEHMQEEVDALALKLSGRELLPAGEVRVTTNDSLLVHLLTSLFAGFQKSCPDVTLDIVLSNAPLNLSRRDADIAIRATDTPPETLIGRRASRIAWALYTPVGLKEEVDAARWVTLGESMGEMKVVREVVANVEARRIAYRANTVLGLGEAIEAGIGIGYLPCFIGDVRPSLKRLAAPDARFATDLWLLTHRDLRNVPRIRSLLDYLAKELTSLRPLLEGERYPLFKEAPEA
ncbi:LysR family transcriptional regulator [Limoniibacter endophyticus]|uniref:LysR family transcriptional regulator n=2 Tax=Limoniibacter endophyticus TaxID=1565040 RepID=A0A8J3DIM7_9HYPH|nr:LysR family transcriptional regulator [Limoniibacter endophyticus]GHC71857.1 LysR family transcriptional regulator [Limoniibacter endophyticus]